MTETNRYYVYALIDPRNSMPFYIGKGKGRRAEQHANAALKLDNDTEASEKEARIRDILRSGKTIEVMKIASFIEEAAAYQFEEELIRANPDLTNIALNKSHIDTGTDELPDIREASLVQLLRTKFEPSGWREFDKRDSGWEPPKVTEDSVITAHPPYFLLSNKMRCWKCNQDSNVIAVVASEVSDPFDDAGAEYVDELETGPALLQYITEMPASLYTEMKQFAPGYQIQFSQTAGSDYYANVCACGGNTGDWYLFNQADAPFLCMYPEDWDDVSIIRLSYSEQFVIQGEYQRIRSPEPIEDLLATHLE